MPMIPRFSLALSILCLACACVAAQSHAKLSSVEGKTLAPERPAAKALRALRQLDQDVIVYRSPGELEESGKLARISLAGFQKNFELAAAEVNSLLPEIPPSKLRTEIINALASYRDGLFWWQQVDQPKVVQVSALAVTETSRAVSDRAFVSTVPYTVAIHWRQAHKYLSKAENLITD